MDTYNSVVVYIMMMYGIVYAEISNCPYLKQTLLSTVMVG
jgi:hypothetical protein